MSKINLLPWRDDVREQKRKAFILVSVLMVCVGLSLVAVTWFFLNQQRVDQEQANQLILAKNQQIDEQLKSLNGLQEQRQAIVDRMGLIQNLQAQRPVAVRLVDELVRVIPTQVYLTRFSRTGESLVIEGKAESPNTVAELIRNMDNSVWFRNVFMSSFIANDKDMAANQQVSILPRAEEKYGSFVVTANIGSIAQPTSANASKGGK
ncbi:PilN domain-containing protein [Acinetobacter rathckeae]|uniref:PilN domain-containing protein n=1 Tax=Acinetobacter rathckeae TaxID=2605272 RepID=UPI0018A30F4E|nr:PilN domain-containing protein [Acinetobacter rathckeae]MBF7688705.1 PilN domain-containing protein [Acinetobacter rathckeae]MBF7696098.1 PilN domain-containing protein [Acinetobacter rathckeae]